MGEQQRSVDDLVFVGFNRQVLGLDRYEGSIVWQWRAPEGSGFVSLLLDGDRLIVGVNGYIYCLDPVFGQEVWGNPLKGHGLGVMSLASTRGSSDTAGQAARIAKQQRQQAAAASATAAG